MSLFRKFSLATLLALGFAGAAVFAAGVPPAPADGKRPLNLTSAFPAPNATNVCPDTPFRLTFTAPPGLGGSGKIQILDAATGTVVETIDTSSPTATKTIGGLTNYKYYPVIISGNEATIHPHDVLSYNKTYYITIDGGVFKAGEETYGAIDKPASWRFTTKAAAPAAGTSKLTIAADGKGDFCTVQGALDFIPDGNTKPTTLFLRSGTYTEMVFFTNKHAITLLGEDRKKSIIAYATNERFNAAGGNPYAGSSDPSSAPLTGNIYHRGVFIAHRVNDLVLANLTLRNTTPQGGSQAEAIILNGTPEARAILKDVDLYSYQDTLQINGQAYLNNCMIEGDVDFMWGTGPCFFENCTARSIRSGAYYTQIRNPPTNHGFVYLHCTFEGTPGVVNNFFSRVATGRFPSSEVVVLDSTLTAAVGAPAWQLQNPPNTPVPPTLHFWEYNSRGADGRPIDVSQRFAASRQLKQPEDAQLIADYSKPAFVLGHDWNPKLAPIFK